MGVIVSVNTQIPFTLPVISFISGTTQEFLFDNFFETADSGIPFDLTDCSASFSVVSFVNRTGTPIVAPKEMTIVPVPQGLTPNTLRVKLDASETVDWPTGKYVYEVAIRDYAGNYERMQGILYVYRNNNPSFIG